MSHHGWPAVLDAATLTPDALKSPFGRLFPAADHVYDSHAISLLAGALGPIQNIPPTAGKGTNPAGFTFLGQFIDHDMTEFRVVGEGFRIILQNPVIGQRQRVLEDGNPTSTNGRLGRLDLDSVYGLLGLGQPDLFDADGLFINDGDDIRRGSQYRNRRLIADPRNDENKIIVQLHLLFERLHNQIHAVHIGTPGVGPGSPAFAKSRRRVQNAYRRIIVHDYLPRIVQPAHLTNVLAALQAGTTFYQAMNKRARLALGEFKPPVTVPKNPMATPVEFSHAVFRLGHSQLRDGYDLNATKSLPLFTTRLNDLDLRGNEPITPDLVIDWKFFFENGTDAPQHGQPIDGTLPASVFRLPPPAIAEPPISLAERNIRRGIDFGLPSGQEAASLLTTVYGYIPATDFDDLFPPVFRTNFKEVLAIDPSLAWATPLWYYIIKEAEFIAGPQLGPVGGYVLAETLLGSLYELKGFDLAAEMARVPGAGVPASADDIFTMAQLLQFLGVFP